MTPKPDSMFVQKSIYDFLEDFECKRPVRWDPLISIYKIKEENDIGENDDEKSVRISKDPREESGLKSGENVQFWEFF